MGCSTSLGWWVKRVVMWFVGSLSTRTQSLHIVVGSMKRPIGSIEGGSSCLGFFGWLITVGLANLGTPAFLEGY